MIPTAKTPRVSSIRMMPRSPRNRTLLLTDEDRCRLRPSLRPTPADRLSPEELHDAVFRADFFELAQRLPAGCVDLLFVDPPYNLTKQFNGRTFRRMSLDDYEAWLEQWLPEILPALKPTASVYICGDWRSSAAIHRVCEKHLVVRNRITFEREKGRGALYDWKNASEDIWFCTVSNQYHFDADAVKLKRTVIAPYRKNGKPRDWNEEADGNFRMTHSSNLWTDITVPFWSMPENTPHPTQKPEKLLAKIILASSRPGDLVFDPFGGAGTTAVVAKKLGRRYAMTEIDEDYCLYALRRLELADKELTIQGYADGVFWERNSGPNIRAAQKDAGLRMQGQARLTPESQSDARPESSRSPEQAATPGPDSPADNRREPA